MVRFYQKLCGFLLNGCSSEAGTPVILQTIQSIFRIGYSRTERDIPDTELDSGPEMDRSATDVFATNQLVARGAPIPPDVSFLVIACPLLTLVQIRPRVYPGLGHHGLLGLGGVRGRRNSPAISTPFERVRDDPSFIGNTRRLLGPVRDSKVPIVVLPVHHVPVILLAPGCGQSRYSVAQVASFRQSYE